MRLGPEVDLGPELLTAGRWFVEETWGTFCKMIIIIARNHNHMRYHSDALLLNEQSLSHAPCVMGSFLSLGLEQIVGRERREATKDRSRLASYC